MLNFLSGLMVVASVAAFVYMLRSFYLGYGILCIKSEPETENDNETAIRETLSLLGEAKESIEIYDDGNDSPGSLYVSDRMIDLIREKLDKTPNVEVKCLLNSKDDTKFKQAFYGSPRIQLYYRKNERPENDVHYKIVDGIKAHLSKHKAQESERRFKTVDLSEVPRFARKNLARRTFGIHRQDEANFDLVAANV